MAFEERARSFLLSLLVVQDWKLEEQLFAREPFRRGEGVELIYIHPERQLWQSRQQFQGCF